MHLGGRPAEEGGRVAEDDLHPAVHSVPPCHHAGHLAQTLAVRDVRVSLNPITNLSTHNR